MPTPRRNILASALLVAALVAGCDALVDRPGISINFGSPYDVLFGDLVSSANGLTQSTPFVDGEGMLHVAVQFTGGCAEHSFIADYSLSETAATVWLVHAANGDLCESIQREEVSVPLSQTVLQKDGLILVDPDGRDEPIARFDHHAFPIDGP